MCNLNVDCCLPNGGVFSPGANYLCIDIEASQCDSYTRLAKKAERKCKVAYEENKHCQPCLFKLNRAQILDETINVKNKTRKMNARPWTPGNYLLLTKKSPVVC